MIRNLKLTSCLLFLAFCFSWQSNAQSGRKNTSELVFKFVPLDNEFYMEQGNNKAVLEQLYAAIDKYRDRIKTGEIPLQVEGYSASAETKEKNKQIAYQRVSRVKSVIITNKQLQESNFQTKNFDKDYRDQNDAVVVRLTLPKDGKNSRAKAMEQAYRESEQQAQIENFSYEDDDVETESQGVTTMAIVNNNIYRNKVGFQLSQFRFQPRGYYSYYNKRYINGVAFNEQNRGTFNYASIGALNDVTRNGDAVDNNDYGLFTYGSLGGAENIDMRASGYTKGGKLTGTYTNRATYYSRLMFSYSTGLMPSGWAVTGSLGGRYSDEGNIEGTFYRNFAYSLGVEKQWDNGTHSLSFNTFGSPVERGQQGSSYMEANTLVGNNLYNPNWGYQNGKKRNSRIVRAFDPTFILSHTWNINRDSRLITGIGYHLGRYGSTSLNWYNSPDPRPDYYRYLPSYSNTKDTYTNWSTNNTDFTQVNWGRLYHANRLQLQQAKTAADSAAVYNVEERRSDLSELTLNSTYKTKLTNNLHFVGGVELKTSKSHQFKVADDLLDAPFLFDYDKFADVQLAGFGDLKQSDLNNPDRKVYKGDIYGYNFDLNIHSANLWFINEHTSKKWDVFYGGKYTFTQFQRDGKMKNGHYPNNSYGKGQMHTFNDYSLKAGLTYKINGRNFISGKASYSTEAPLPFNAYISSRITDKTLPLESGKLLTMDLSYIFSYPNVNGRVSLYQTNFYDQTARVSYYHDVKRTFVNHIVTGMEKTLRGVELGVSVKATSALTFDLAGTISEQYYSNNPMGTTTYENASQPDISERVYYKNYYVGGSPQFAGTLGARYFIKYWFLGVNVNGIERNYINISPLRHMASTYASLNPNEPADLEAFKLLTSQEKLPGAITLDFSVGKIMYLPKGHSMNFNLSVNNVLNKKDIRTGGYEQGRVDVSFPTKFNSKYFFMQGINCFLNASYRF